MNRAASSHWYASGMRAATTVSAEDFWVSACFTWCGERSSASLSPRIESHAR